MSTIEVPIIILGGNVIFPHTTLLLEITDENTIKLVRDALKTNQPTVGVIQAKPETPGKPAELYTVGCLATIHKVQRLSKKEIGIILSGVERIETQEYIQRDFYLIARVTSLFDEKVEEDEEIKNWKINLREQIKKISQFRPLPSPDYLTLLLSIEEPGLLADVASFHYLEGKETQDILETLNVKERLKKTVDYLSRKIPETEIDSKIDSQAEERAAAEIKKFHLRQKLEEIKKELGEDSSDSDEIKKHREKILRAQMPPEAEKEALETLERLAHLSPGAGEYPYLDTWLNLMENLPWSKSTEDRIDIKTAEKILNKDHFGLEKVKKRILEFLAVRKLKPQGRGPILCFIGPPGTGKTSVGKSIAGAMGRKFIRISLGGVYDESQIRGHRRTYIAALPGVIIENLKKAGSNNPVFMIDEIDKIGTSALQGDPSSALLEALDSEQNSSFSDHYLGTHFDLSKVLFICTGNLAEPIQPALRDRMEIIDFPGYTREEKLMIAKKYLVPRQLEANGLTKDQLIFQDKALQSIIKDYTEEAGVRNLEREIGNVCRTVATKIAKGEISQMGVDAPELSRILGPRHYLSRVKEMISRPGVAIGLAWTSVGGKILFIETEIIRGVREPALEITGNVEKIMQESAKIALTFVTANLTMLGIAEDRSPVGHKICLHVPEAATPKDGPSAGLAIFVALVSLLTKKRVRHDVAMTGEITLRGLVQEVGGIQEKVLAAKEAGIKTIILPKENEKDIPDLPQSVRKALGQKEIEIKFISETKEALEIAFNNQNPSTAAQGK